VEDCNARSLIKSTFGRLSRRYNTLKFLSVTVLAGASAIAALVPSQAEAVPVASWGGFVTVTGTAPTQSANIATFGTQAVSSADGTASVQSNPTPLPALTATATANASANGSNALGTLNYFFEISGPQANSLSVNVLANGSLFSDSGTMHSTAFLRVNGTTIVNTTSDGGNNNGAFTTSATLSGLSYNTPYLVEMNVSALAHPSGTATAFLDPYLFLDPSLVALGDSIITSDGIGNNLTVNAAVPEPSTWAMMILGFFGVGFMGYRRRNQSPSLRTA
jgi:hypothetical protein